MEVSGQLHAPAALFPENEYRYPSERRLNFQTKNVSLETKHNVKKTLFQE
jgi:hypothetical protein